jgi:hypothetical protein
LPVLLFLALALLEDPSPRSALLRESRRTGEFLVVIGASSAEMEGRMRAAAESLRRRGTIALLGATEAKEADLARPGVILVGTPRSNPWVRKAAESLPIPPGEDGIRLRDTVYTRARDSLQLVYPSPFHPDGLLTLFTGNSDAAVLDSLASERRGDFHLRREKTTLVLGRFRDDWSLDPQEILDLENEPAPPAETFTLRLQEARSRFSGLFGSTPPLPELRLHASLERKGLATENTKPAHLDGSLLHAVASAAEPERLVLERWLEPRIPDETLRRGLSIVLASSETELERFDRTSFRLSRLREPPRLASLKEETPFVRDAMSASFARFVVRKRGAEALGETLSSLEPLERPWLQSLEPERPESPPPLPPFLRGFSFTHEGFQIHDGYLSARSDRSLETLHSLGVDSVAIVPFAFLSDPRETSLSVPERPGSETDEAVLHAIREAKSRGMTVLLKPQIWLRRSWPGEIDPSTPEGEETFFREYRKWLLHYALMAEENEVELLSIGTELSKMTLPRRTPFWEALIRDVRVLYRGRLVYAANWGEEVERIGFWPLLDFIGVDFYYPLSSLDSPTDEDLRLGFEASLGGLRSLSRRLSKPVLLTEIGYGSTVAPWKSPHASDRGKTVSPEDQARAYEAAFAALADERAWVRGLFWWKWPSDLSHGGPGDPGFTPSGKPAEDAIRRHYGSRIE